MPHKDHLTVMKDRIRQIMESLNMSQQVFAQFIEMSPASLSGIFTERTRPTLNTVEAIKKKIPNINIDWLMFGTGNMYIESEDGAMSSGERPIEMTEPMLDFDASDISASPSTATDVHGHDSGRNMRPEIIRGEIKYIDRPQRKITEIRIYFDDLTFETFLPSKEH